MAEEIINQGIQAAQAGDTALAQKLLVEAVRQYPQSSRAWLWQSLWLKDRIKEQLNRLDVNYSEPKPKFRWRTTPIPDSD